MRDISFHQPADPWIFVTVQNVPEAHQPKVKEVLGRLQGAATHGLLKDGKTMFTNVRSRKNYEGRIESDLMSLFGRLGIASSVVLEFRHFWALTITLKPFITASPSHAELERNLRKLPAVEDVDWLPDDDELVVWLKNPPAPPLLENISRILS